MGKRKRKEILSLVINATEPAKTTDGWEVVVIAALLFKKRFPAKPSREILFLVDGNEVERISSNEESGQASARILFPQPGNYLLTIFVKDLPGIRWSKRISIRKPEEKPKRPAKLLFHQGGSKGEYNLFFQVLTEDNFPVADAVIRIMDPDGEKKVFDLPATDKNGSVVHTVEFRGKEKILTAFVLGSALSEKIHIFGP